MWQCPNRAARGRGVCSGAGKSQGGRGAKGGPERGKRAWRWPGARVGGLKGQVCALEVARGRGRGRQPACVPGAPAWETQAGDRWAMGGGRAGAGGVPAQPKGGMPGSFVSKQKNKKQKNNTTTKKKKKQHKKKKKKKTQKKNKKTKHNKNKKKKKKKTKQKKKKKKNKKKKKQKKKKKNKGESKQPTITQKKPKINKQK